MNTPQPLPVERSEEKPPRQEYYEWIDALNDSSGLGLTGYGKETIVSAIERFVARGVAAMQPRDARALEVVEALTEALELVLKGMRQGYVKDWLLVRSGETELLSERLAPPLATARQYINEMKEAGA